MNRLRIVIGVGLALAAAGVGLGKFATTGGPAPVVSAPEIARARDGRGRFPRGGAVSGNVPLVFCDQVRAGDKSGNWSCLNGDLTTASGSAFSWSSVGTAPTSGGATCQSPSKATLAGIGSYIRSPVRAFPIIDWSWCIYADVPASGKYSFGSFTTGTSTYTVTQETDTSWTQYATVGNGAVTKPAAGPLVYCLVSVSNTVTLYFNGVSQTSFSVTPSDFGSERWFVGTDGLSAGGGLYGLTGAVYGTFVTEKALSQADVTRLSKAWACK